PAAGRLREPDLDGVGAGGGHHDTVEAFERLDPALDLARLAELVAEPFDEALRLRDLALLHGGRPLQLGNPLLALLDEVRVVAEIFRQRSAPQLCHAVGDGVDEVPVVADEDETSGIGVAARLGELRLDMAEPMADPAHRPGAGHDLGQDAAPGRVRDVLAEVADDHVLPAYDRARVRLLLAGDDLEQRRLAGTVRAD